MDEEQSLGLGRISERIEVEKTLTWLLELRAKYASKEEELWEKLSVVNKGIQELKDSGIANNDSDYLSLLEHARRLKREHIEAHKEQMSAEKRILELPELYKFEEKDIHKGLSELLRMRATYTVKVCELWNEYKDAKKETNEKAKEANSDVELVLESYKKEQKILCAYKEQRDMCDDIIGQINYLEEKEKEKENDGRAKTKVL